jgi:hypothetical protein
MLRVTQVDRDDRTVLLLEGRLAGKWIEEMQRASDTAGARCLPVTIDLGSLSYMDLAGIELVRSLHGRGFVFSNCSRFIAELLNGVAPC